MIESSIDPLERGRLWVVLMTVAINVVAVLLLAFASWSDWRTGLALNFIDNCLLVGFAVVKRDALFSRFLIFGLAVGVAELAADAWPVDYTRTLDYSIGGAPMIWRSPIWMPLAWEVVAVQFGYVGLRLWERFGGAGLLLVALLARTLRRGSWRVAIAAGIAGGMSIFLCNAVAFFITDPLIS